MSLYQARTRAHPQVIKYYNQTEFIYVGDADHDAQACKAAGGRFVLINTREYDDETIESFTPLAVVESLAQLPESLDSS